MEPKPAHLGPEYGAQFRDRSVADMYATRPPYPVELFEALLELMPEEGSRTVLDLGCGTGDVALGLASGVDRVDAVDPSAAMLAVARGRRGAEHPALHWHAASAEEFEFRGPYSLVVAAESVHWMEWQTVFPKIVAAVRPDGFFALVGGRAIAGVPWEREVLALIPRYSTNREYRPYDIVEELTRRGLFREVGRHATRPHAFEQSLEDYIESFHTRNGFSRERMTAENAAAFDDAVRALAASHCPDGIVRGTTRAVVIWGVPGQPDANATTRSSPGE